MNEYRMTRPNCYPGDNEAKTDLSIRQGHYILAEDEADAHRIMRKMFPNDTHFDLQLWQRDVKHERDSV